MTKAVFLDRDGTINHDTGHLHKPEELMLIQGAIEAIKEIRNKGFIVIVVTNQAGIAKGLYTEDDVNELHGYINQKLKLAGAAIDAFYYCPHHPGALIEKYRIECECRKPKPGMLLKAIEELKINPHCSFMIGDKESDMLAGKNAGIAHNLLVRSGCKTDEINTVADGIYDNLKDLVLAGGLERQCHAE
ncbi:MAG: D-glycero-beta-D-manno-heptose 1,7-bisphosphate 7-phosphatase [Bacteroidales bacterium]|nr:D-glycero-beta-D-manno-heptose 1,7-bisphosphate 7-phosphatase [Bacteroidales bacterium]